MFNIRKLKLVSDCGEEYDYHFLPGLNYIQGKNAKGKTLFYRFLDYMLGDDQPEIAGWDGFAGLCSATLEFQINGIEYSVQRFLAVEKYSFSREGVVHSPSTLDDLKILINDAFCLSESSLGITRSFMHENLTYRAFTLFNFLGEKRQGVLNDFFDKADQVKHRVRESELLNLIFNQNPSLIQTKENDLENLEQELVRVRALHGEQSFISEQINQQLAILKSPVSFSGSNVEEIIKIVDDFENKGQVPESKKDRTYPELSFMLNSLDNQINDLSRRLSEGRQIDEENKRRSILLSELDSLIEGNPDYSYLVQPTRDLLKGMSGSLSLKDKRIQEDTLSRMKAARGELLREIALCGKKYLPFSVDEKKAALVIVKDCFRRLRSESCSDQVAELKSQISKLRQEIKNLKRADNEQDLESVSKSVSGYYSSAVNQSSFVAEDMSMSNFSIRYIKNGNTLQPQFTNEGVVVNFYCGSHARQTLIQLCGYCAFIEFLLNKGEYPLVPLLVIDHVSKPLDKDSKRAVGAIFLKLYERVNKSNLQTFLFGTEEPEELDLRPEKTIRLVESGKAGFNPFFESLPS